MLKRVRIIEVLSSKSLTQGSFCTACSPEPPEVSFMCDGCSVLPRGGTCQQLWDTRELHLVSLDYGEETREVGAIDINIDQDLVA